MTNFEKWKETMTLEKLMGIFEGICMAELCPAFETCKETEGCKESWIKWAGTEADG